MKKLSLILAIMLLPAMIYAGGVMMVGGGTPAEEGGASALYTAATAIWDFENNANDTKEVKTLTANNTPTYGSTSPPQGSYYTILNGSNQYFSRADDNDLDFTDDYSMSFWVYCTETWSLVIATKTTDTSAGYKISGGTGAGIITVQHVGASSNFSGVVPVNTWTHVCFKYDQSENLITYWISTTSFGSVSNAATVAQATDPTDDAAAFWIGRDGGTYYPGNMDEVVIWKGYCITATDAANLYAHTWR